MKTSHINRNIIQKQWWVIDATDTTVGRIASQVSILLQGKHKICYSKNRDCGDYVVIINTKHLKFSGKKSSTKDGKTYYRHTGFVGGLKTTNAKQILSKNKSEIIFANAVKRMLSKNKLGKKQFKKLYLYHDSEHPHISQKCQVLNYSKNYTTN